MHDIIMIIVYQLPILIIDGIGSAVLKGSDLNADEMISFLIKKYKI